MMMRIATVAAGLALMAQAAWAECPMMMDHAGHDMRHDMNGMNDMPMTVKGHKTPSSEMLATANMSMHKDMDIVYTGDADIDFLRGMIAHHQGAIDMAKVQLAYGKDAQVKRLAREIIRAQTQEIHWMKTWLTQLEAKGATPTPADAKPAAGWFERGWIGSTWLGER